MRRRVGEEEEEEEEEETIIAKMMSAKMMIELGSGRRQVRGGWVGGEGGRRHMLSPVL